jgi:hypothetical protein
MTQDPTQAGALSPDKVAELEHKLANAAAEVAKVQAQLQQAQQAGQPTTAQPPPPAGQPLSTSPPPGAGAPGSTIPPVPYAGTGSPHVITINGQQVVPGSGNLLQVLQQLGRAGAAGGGAPVVMVNGQQVSGGQAVDIGSYLTPEVTQRIQESLSHLGLNSGMSALFGHPTPPGPPEVVAPLAEPPRHVPFSYRLATFDLSGYELFILLMGVVGPIALWAFEAVAVPAGLIVAVLGIAVFRIRRYNQRIPILKWGKVATVTNHEPLDVGTYYSGVTYQNMRKRTASGWNVTTSWYSGPGYKNKVDYSVDGVTGTLEFRGLEYTDGVILADSRKQDRALCVVQLPYSVKPGPDGQFTGELSAWKWGGIIATLVIELTVAYLAVVSVLDIWVNR